MGRLWPWQTTGTFLDIAASHGASGWFATARLPAWCCCLLASRATSWTVLLIESRWTLARPLANYGRGRRCAAAAAGCPEEQLSAAPREWWRFVACGGSRSSPAAVLALRSGCGECRGLKPTGPGQAGGPLWLPPCVVGASGDGGEPVPGEAGRSRLLNRFEVHADPACRARVAPTRHVRGEAQLTGTQRAASALPPWTCPARPLNARRPATGRAFGAGLASNCARAGCACAGPPRAGTRSSRACVDCARTHAHGMTLVCSEETRRPARPPPSKVFHNIDAPPPRRRPRADPRQADRRRGRERS
eukprot:366200-Chlamydomonas_euryale.AAC.8